MTVVAGSGDEDIGTGESDGEASWIINADTQRLRSAHLQDFC